MVALWFAGLHTAIAIVGPMVIYSFGVGLTLPQAMAGAMMPFPRMAGAASALVGFLQMASGALAGALVGAALDGASPSPMIFTIAVMGACTCLAVLGRALVGGAEEAAPAE